MLVVLRTGIAVFADAPLAVLEIQQVRKRPAFHRRQRPVPQSLEGTVDELDRTALIDDDGADRQRFHDAFQIGTGRLGLTLRLDQLVFALLQHRRVGHRADEVAFLIERRDAVEARDRRQHGAVRPDEIRFRLQQFAGIENELVVLMELLALRRIHFQRREAQKALRLLARQFDIGAVGEDHALVFVAHEAGDRQLVEQSPVEADLLRMLLQPPFAFLLRGHIEAKHHQRAVRPPLRDETHPAAGKERNGFEERQVVLSQPRGDPAFPLRRACFADLNGVQRPDEGGKIDILPGLLAQQCAIEFPHVAVGIGQAVCSVEDRDTGAERIQRSFDMIAGTCRQRSAVIDGRYRILVPIGGRASGGGRVRAWREQADKDRKRRGNPLALQRNVETSAAERMAVARALGRAEDQAAALRIVAVAVARRFADLVAALADHFRGVTAEERCIGVVHRQIAQFAALDVGRMGVFANTRAGRHQQFVLSFSHAKRSPMRDGGRDS